MTLFEEVLQDGRKSQKGDFYLLRKPENVVRVIYEQSYELMTLSLWNLKMERVAIFGSIFLLGCELQKFILLDDIFLH